MRDDLTANIQASNNGVTGSRNLVTIKDQDGKYHHILIDCGYFQEEKWKYLNYLDDVNVDKIEAIILTHNHIDHTGLVPKLVNRGYRGPIYCTDITAELLTDYWMDSLKMQPDECKKMREKYPDSRINFKPLFTLEDVKIARLLVVAFPYKQTIRILPDVPNIQVTLFNNGHLLGAAYVLLQIIDYRKNRKNLNFLFTGDFCNRNPFYPVDELPNWVKKLELVIVTESTYGTTKTTDIVECFEENLKEAFRKKQNILIGAFAQGRMQQVLQKLRKMQKNGDIPSEYEIYFDGPLGIRTTYKYESIFDWFCPEVKEFKPDEIKVANPKARQSFLDDVGNGKLKILVTTSGMLSNGPAKEYVPLFLGHNNTLIHLTGYAAEGTLARKLIDCQYDSEITLGGQTITKKAEIKTTREFSLHPMKDEIEEFLTQFAIPPIVFIIHGEPFVKESLADELVQKFTAGSNKKIKQVEVLDRSCFYRIRQAAPDLSYVYSEFNDEGKRYNSVEVKRMPSKFVEYEHMLGKEVDRKNRGVNKVQQEKVQLHAKKGKSSRHNDRGYRRPRKNSWR